MDLNPDDIVGYRFKQSLRGYAIEEVDQLLDRLADQIEQMAAELDACREQARAAEAQTVAIRETEATLQRTLVVAQQAAERNLADASAQAEAMVANATADAERLRREAEEEAAARRQEADAEAAETVDRAQQLARREVDAARARVEQAAARHAEVLTDVAFHRDALRAHLASLDELALEPAPSARPELFAGELADADFGDRDPSDPGDEGGPEEDATTPLTIRVHEGHQDPSPHDAPLGSEVRDGD